MAGVEAGIRFLAEAGGAAPGSEAEGLRAGLEGAYDAFHERGEELVARMWAGLGGIPGVRLYGPEPGSHPRTPTVAFTVEGAAAGEVARRLSEEHGVFVSHGDFYAAHVPGDLGVEGGLVRAGCACYTTEEEVERLVEGVAGMA